MNRPCAFIIARHAAARIPEQTAGENLPEADPTLHEFLEEYMVEIGSKSVIPHLKEGGKTGWFVNYREFFEKHLNTDWAANGTDLGLLEQVILARNDFTYNVDLFSLVACQTRFHSDKYPHFAFVDQKWKALFAGGDPQRILPLVVPFETLQY